jgi:beta-phosphoglucomutase family hydrolase
VTAPATASPASNPLAVPPHIRGLIFDCDGTLADTMPLHWRAWEQVAAQHRFAITEERFYALAGIPSRDILRDLGREQRLDFDPLAVARDKEQAYLALLDHVGPIDRILDIARAHRGRLPMAIASGGTRHIIERVLAHLDIRDLFDAVVTSEDVVRQKPSPDIFLEAARRLGVPPEACLAYEDAELGLQAIRSAGMAAVDVRTTG